MSPWMNRLHFGDNLPVMREHIPDGSVDLIYLDPPFNSKATYNVLFKEKNGSESSAQITAFEDTWCWDTTAADAYHELVTRGPKKLADLMAALHSFLGQNDMMAYLAMMAIRLVEMRRVLKDTGSMYLHCDPTASHYLKMLMDSIFGKDNFKNEIIWSYIRYTAVSKRFQRLHDVILFYTKTEDYLWNDMREDYSSKSGAADSHYKQDEEGQWFRWQKRKNKEPYKIFLSDGKRMGDVWTIPHINASAKERLGYPTQKPEALLERIIRASSNEGDVVLDPFCGCGTTVNVAERLRRRWIGIDITHLAVTLIKHRLADTFGQELSPYEIVGDPKDIESARALALENRHQFEWWALSLVGALPAQDKRKGADKGVDGFMYFFDEENGPARKVVVQVKSGHVNASQIRDLKGAIEREKAVIGVFITLENSTAPMRGEAADAGFYEFRHVISGLALKFPRIQIYTIEELLGGVMVKIPAHAVEDTIKKAARKKKTRSWGGQILLL